MNRRLTTVLRTLLPPLLLLGAAVPAAADGLRYLATARATPLEFSSQELIGGPATIIEHPSHGWLHGNLSGDFVYFPHDEFIGVDQFRLRRLPGEVGEEFDVLVSVAPARIPVAGDWDGNLLAEVGLYQSDVMELYLFEENVSNPSVFAYTYVEAEPGWWPFAGDFDGDGFGEVGLYDPSTGVFHLLLLPPDPLPPPELNELVAYREWAGTPLGAGEIPVAGDWFGDGGEDGIGLFVPGFQAIFHLWDDLEGDFPIEPFVLQAPGAYPVAGDWDGDTQDTVGLYDPATGTFHLLNGHEGGPADEVRTVSSAAGLERLPLAGDWFFDGNAKTSIGLLDAEVPSFALYEIGSNDAAKVVVIPDPYPPQPVPPLSP